MNNRIYMKGLAVVLIITLLIMSAVGIKLSGKEKEINFTSYEMEEDQEISEEKNLTSHIFVDIDGAVKIPGVYQFNNGDRINDAIIMAGGLAEDACTKNLNKAEKLTDGEKIFIPRAGEDSDGSSDSGLININSASMADLISLPGVGETYAQRIVDYRNEKTFGSIEEIKNIKGIGDKTFEKMKDLITVD